MLDNVELMKPGKLDSVSDINLASHFCELKLDGMRAKIGRRLDGSVDLFSFAGKSQLGKCLHLEEMLLELPPGTVLDGEFVLYKDCAIVEAIDAARQPVKLEIPNFTFTMNVMGSKPDKAIAKQEAFGTKMSMIAFDVIAYNGKKQTSIALHWRRETLEEIITKYWGGDNWIRLSKLLTYTLELEADLVAQGAEGIMFKNHLAPYEEGKRPKNNWWKYKFEEEADVVIMGFTEGLGKYSDTVGAIVFGQYRDGSLVERGQTSGMTDALRRDMGSNRQAYIGRTMVVKHRGVLKDAYRHPQFKVIRPEGDKPAELCVWE